jgi:hypothetical protein
LSLAYVCLAELLSCVSPTAVAAAARWLLPVVVCCSGIVLRVLFHPKQLMLFTSDDQGEVRVWDLVTKAPAFKNMAKVGWVGTYTSGFRGALRLQQP